MLPVPQAPARPAESDTPEDTMYPDYGEPVPESQITIDQREDLRLTLRHHFRDVPDVYIHGDLFVYYERGNPQACVAPDVFVVRGVGKHRRRTYLVWNEVKVPDVVFEITSDATHDQDTGRKFGIYERLGVQEYFLYDPEGGHLRPQLQGYRLIEGRYQPVAPNPAGRLASAALSLELGMVGDWLRLYDPAQGRWLPTVEEAMEAAPAAEARAAQEAASRRDAETRAAAEAAGRQQAEAEVARLRALLSQQQP